MKEIYFLKLKLLTLGLMFSVAVFSQLGIPVVHIDLHNNRQIGNITKETKILADMRIENANGSNFPPEMLFNNQIRIKGRGNSSWNSPEAEKKSYSIDLVNNADRRIDVPLLGMPRESNFILYASFFDKTHIRNYFSYHLATAMGHWASRSRFVELYINGDYRGLYVVGENIRQGADRMDVKEGGFILEQDYPQRLQREGDEYITSSRTYTGRYYGDARETDHLYFSFQYPADGDRTDAQTEYISDYIAAFEEALYGDNFAHPTEGYRKYVDVHSFVDWYIISELAGDWDHCEFLSSCYISKPEGGKLQMMPVWDFDVGYKVYVEDLHARIRVPWISRMWQDATFRQLVFARFAELAPILDDALSHVQEVAEQLNHHGVIDRNFERWDILGKRVWPENQPYAAREFIPSTYAGEIRKLTQWIRQRFLHIATNGNSNYCEVLSKIKPSIHTIDQNLYERGQLPMAVETSRFQTGVSGVTTTYVWNNANSASREHTINSYGDHRLTIRIGNCESQTSVLSVKELAPVTVSGNEYVYDATSKNVTVSTSPPSLPVRVTYNGRTEPPVAPGVYRVVAEIDHEHYKGQQVSTMEIKLLDPALVDATLKNITVSSGGLSPDFSANITEYDLNVSYDVTAITVAVTTNQEGARVERSVTNYPLNIGSNPIPIRVTARDGITEKTYTVRVTRSAYTVASVEVVPGNATIEIGDTQQFSAEVTRSGESVYSSLILNEVSGEHKYVEIFNSSDEEISLEGVIIQRNEGPVLFPANGSEWVGTAADVIPAGAYRLILFRDATLTLFDNPAFVGWEVTSGISDQQILKVAIVDPSGNELDVFIRGEEPLPAWQSTQGVTRNRIQSYSRMSDGSWAYAEPTPGAVNGNKMSDIVSPGYLTITNDVIWTLSGASSLSTTINTNGLLTVAANETATTLTVRATSKVDNSKFGVATVTIQQPIVPEVIITVTPTDPTVIKGDSQQFAAQVKIDDVELINNLVINEVSGEHKYVEIYNSGDEDISLEGVKLQRNGGPATGGSEWTGTAADAIPAGEYRLFLFNSFTTGLDNNPAFTGWTLPSGISDQQILKVALVDPSGYEISVFIRGEEPLPAWQTTQDVTRNRVHSYSRMSDGSWAYAIPTPGEENDEKEEDIISPGYISTSAVTWSVSGAVSSSTTINANGLLTVANDETAKTLTVTATSTAYDSKFGMTTVVIHTDAVTNAEELFVSELNAYPNPFMDAVRITGVDAATISTTTLRVFNMAGATVHTQIINNPEEIVNLEHLPAGVYVFSIESNGNVKTIRVVKN